MRRKFYEFLACTSGATGIEYGIILGSVGTAIMTGAFMFGNDFESVLTGLSAWMNADPIE